MLGAGVSRVCSWKHGHVCVGHVRVTILLVSSRIYRGGSGKCCPAVLFVLLNLPVIALVLSLPYVDDV